MAAHNSLTHAAYRQTNPDSLFEAAHSVAERRTRHTHPLRRAGEASFLRDREEGCQHVEVVELHW